VEAKGWSEIWAVILYVVKRVSIGQYYLDGFGSYSYCAPPMASAF